MANINGMDLIDDLFYDKELQRDKFTWEILNSGDSVIKGLILDDDLNFSISNNFGTGSGDILSNTLKSYQNTAKSYAAYGNTAVKEFDNLGSKLGLGNIVSDTTDTINKLANYAFKAMGGVGNLNAQSIINGNYLTPADLVKVFQGTDIKLQMPQLTTTVFHRTGTNCLDYLSKLAKVFTGDVISLGGVMGYQEAPNGYKPNLEVINKNVISENGTEGTFDLRWGYVTLHSILVTGITWNQSKFTAMNADGSSSGDPIYIEFKIDIELSTAILRNDLLTLINSMKSNK